MCIKINADTVTGLAPFSDAFGSLKKSRSGMIERRSTINAIREYIFLGFFVLRATIQNTITAPSTPAIVKMMGAEIERGINLGETSTSEIVTNRIRLFISIENTNPTHPAVSIVFAVGIL